MPAAEPAIRALLETRSAVLADVGPAAAPEARLLVRSDLTGTMQLYELAGGELRQHTALPEPVASAHYVPGTRQAVLAIDAGGNERHQLYRLDLDAARANPAARSHDLDAARASPAARSHDLEALTADPRYGHRFAGVSPDGGLLAYLSNRGNGVDFDLWLCELETRAHRCLYAGGAWCQPASGFSPGGRIVSVLRPGERPLDNDLVLVDVDTGEARTVLTHADEPALVGPPAWIDESTFYASTTAGADFARIVRYDLATGATTPLFTGQPRFDQDVVSSRDGSAVVVIENRDGVSAPLVYHGPSGTPGDAIALPEPGVLAGEPRLSADGARLYYTLSTPRLASDVFAYDLAAKASRRLTRSPAAFEPGELHTPDVPPTRVPSFDDERIPAFVYRPAQARAPVVVLVHGGPEAQATLAFNPVIQGLVKAGYGVVVPNVRGSTGYGKRYASLDDTRRRLDAVRDLAAVHEALAQLGFDGDRAALWGGSYGGYMVLAGLAFQPRLWAAGVDIVGISDLITFLEHTSDYRRAHREREYGSLTDDREFLAAASPLRHADAIRAPLFVIHGRNDPRVPVSEAEQLAANLTARGVRCTLQIYEDEGHGLARLENRLDAYPRAVAFLDEVLGRGG